MNGQTELTQRRWVSWTKTLRVSRCARGIIVLNFVKETY
jgi:hypothetical protein